jgi:hypothetical protein
LKVSCSYRTINSVQGGLYEVKGKIVNENVYKAKFIFYVQRDETHNHAAGYEGPFYRRKAIKLAHLYEVGQEGKTRASFGTPPGCQALE